MSPGLRERLRLVSKFALFSVKEHEKEEKERKDGDVTCNEVGCRIWGLVRRCNLAKHFHSPIEETGHGRKNQGQPRKMIESLQR